MKQIHIFGPCIGPEGYSEVTRGIVQALYNRGWNVKLEPFPHWGPWKVKLTESMGKLLHSCTNSELYPQTTPIPHLHVCLPEQVRSVDSHYNVNFTMFEADRIAQSWVNHIRVVDKVIVPNTFCKDVFSRSGVPNQKIGIVPLGVDTNIFNPDIEPIPLENNQRPLSSFPIRIVSVLEVTNRKNFAGLLKLYFRIAAKLNSDNCCLILKAVNYSTHLALADRIKALKLKFISEGHIPDIKYNVFNYSPIVPQGDMGAFMRNATHYLSLSLAEGWDMNCLNAMACKIPVIVPNHSGYTAYCTHKNACILPIAKRIPAEQQGATGRLYGGASWFAPDEDESSQIAIHYIGDAQECKIRAQSAYEDVLSKYTWDTCVSQLEEHLLL